MSAKYQLEVELPYEIHAKVQALASEHAVGVEDFVVELIIDAVGPQLDVAVEIPEGDYPETS